jgi:hypothetical protein
MQVGVRRMRKEDEKEEVGLPFEVYQSLTMWWGTTNDTNNNNVQ